ARLTVDRADIDDAAEAPLQHAVPGDLAHVETTAEIGVQHFVPTVAAHLLHGAVAGDAGIVDDDLDGTERGRHLLHARLAILEGRDIPFEDGDAGLFPERLGAFVIARIVGGDLVARLFKADGNRFTDAARAAGHHCHPCHVLALHTHCDAHAAAD